MKKKPTRRDGPCVYPPNNRLYWEARARHACDSGLKWLETAPPDLSGIPESYAEWAAEEMSDLLNYRQIMSVIRSAPRYVSAFAHRLKPKYVDILVDELPEIITPRLQQIMTRDQIRRAVKRVPAMMIWSTHIASVCPREDVEEQIRINPGAAAKNLWGKFLGPDMIGYIVEASPNEAILWLSEFLTDSHKDALCRTVPDKSALWFDKETIRRNFRHLMHGSPETLSCLSKSVLTPSQRGHLTRHLRKLKAAASQSQEQSKS